MLSSDLVTDASLHRLVDQHRLHGATATALFAQNPGECVVVYGWYGGAMCGAMCGMDGTGGVGGVGGMGYEQRGLPGLGDLSRRVNQWLFEL